MMPETANQLSIELIRYYQQKDALVLIMDENPLLNDTNKITLNFYNDKIKSLRSRLKTKHPERLAKIDAQRKDDSAIRKPAPC
jgi:hypothetical protein